jgi:hypothetical protein
MADLVLSPTQWASKNMASTEIRTDGKKTNLSAFERKMARQRPEFIPQDVMDKVAREHAAFFRSMDMGKTLTP